MFPESSTKGIDIVGPAFYHIFIYSDIRKKPPENYIFWQLHCNSAFARVCLKNAFRKMYVTICGKFCPDEGAVAGYGN